MDASAHAVVAAMHSDLDGLTSAQCQPPNVQAGRTLTSHAGAADAL